MKPSVCKTILLLIYCLNSSYSHAQSIETGYTKEYNGEKAKTPLAGVELNVNGAPSTISDTQGKYELKFAVLQPGEAVKCTEIYKAGYVIFNKDALDYWRISNRKKPFVIVMCKETAFRELKKKFYGIIEKSYREEYLKQKAIAEQTASNSSNLKTQLKKLKEEYEKKLGHIHTYVELFARIDRHEMDSIVRRALKLIEEGKIEEGIKAYEELKLVQQVERQLDKWHSGENMRQAAETMISESQRDLIVLTEKLQQQIGLYEMGGSNYTEKCKKLIAQLIEVYRPLNTAFAGKYNEELGTWICHLADLTKPWDEKFESYYEAAHLPSWHGLVNLANHYNMLAYNHPPFVDSTRICYQKALEMNMPDSLKMQVRRSLILIADFCSLLADGNILYYKKLGDTDSIYVSSKTNACYNRVAGTLKIPAKVVHGGRTYHVTGISYKAFFKNKHLKKVILPNSIHSIGQNAFEKCDSLETIILGNNMRNIGMNAIPLTTTVVLPSQMKEIEWLGDFLQERLTFIDKNPHLSYYRPARRLLSDLAKNKSITKDQRAFSIAQMGYLDFQYGDTLHALNYLLEASKQLDGSFDTDIGQMYYSQKDYINAYKYFKKSAETNNSSAYNFLAYMYAKGNFVEQNYSKAMSLIDKAIALAPANENYIDSKGEFYLMMGKRDSAGVYWNKVLEMNPQVDTNSSDLYKQLYPSIDTTDTNRRNKSNFDMLQYATIAQYVSYALYQQQKEGFCEIEYEELLSIGIIALQALIRDKTKEEIGKYPQEYIATAIEWAIRDEISIRYDWFKSAYPENWGRLSLKETDTTEIAMQTIIRANIYRTIYRIFHLIKSENLERSPYMKQISKDTEDYFVEYGENIVNVIHSLPLAERAIARELIMSSKTYESIAETYHMTLQESNRIVGKIKTKLKQDEK